MLKSTPARKKYTTTGCVVVTSTSLDCIGQWAIYWSKLLLSQYSASQNEKTVYFAWTFLAFALSATFWSNGKGSFAQQVFFKALLCEYISLATFPISSKVLNAQVLTAVRWDFRLQASDTRICCIAWFGKKSRLVKRSFNSSQMVM